jgi:8-oxo-dGTP pyrophosphatase MutT (NUDIX family)
MEPIPRVSARVLPVSPDGEVLLLQDQDPSFPGVLRWGTIGGAVDAGETHEQAAVRELWEETGLVVETAALTAPFLRSTHDFTWGGTHYRTDSTFFAMPLHRDVEVTFDHLEDEEVGNVFAWQWWTPGDLAVSGGMVEDTLPAIMTEAIALVLGTDR